MTNDIAKVYHSVVPRTGFKITAVWPKDYMLVANVVMESENSNPDEAWQKTNHIDNPWWENEGVERVGYKDCRSSDVGDVILTKNGLFRCESVGWSQLVDGDFVEVK